MRQHTDQIRDNLLSNTINHDSFQKPSPMATERQSGFIEQHIYVTLSHTTTNPEHYAAKFDKQAKWSKAYISPEMVELITRAHEQQLLDELNTPVKDIAKRQRKKEKKSPEIASPQSIIKLIKDETQLSYTDVGHILQTHRSTIDRWLKNPDAPIRSANILRIHTVHKALQTIKEIINHPFGHLMYSTLVDNQCILDLLCENEIDIDSIKSVATSLAESIEVETLTTRGALAVHDAFENPKPPTEKALKALKRFKELGLHLQNDED